MIGWSSIVVHTMKEIYCKIYGNVQNVTFRQFAQKKAFDFKVNGTVQNSDDGSVEVVAQGREEDLRFFLEAISVGPEEAEVESLNVQWGPAQEPMNGFQIL